MRGVGAYVDGAYHPNPGRGGWGGLHRGSRRGRGMIAREALPAPVLWEGAAASCGSGRAGHQVPRTALPRVRRASAPASAPRCRPRRGRRRGHGRLRGGSKEEALREYMWAGRREALSIRRRTA